MTDHEELPRVVRASREIAADAGRIFELIADPARQPHWDGNDNLAEAAGGQRVRHVGDVFTMTLTEDGAVRENHVVEFDEGRRIAWRPAEPGQDPPGHLWRWELEPIDSSRTRVTHTYDWSQLRDEKRLRRAQATTEDNLLASIKRLATASGDVTAEAGSRCRHDQIAPPHQGSTSLSGVGVLARFEVAAGNEDAVDRFFGDGRAIVDATQPHTTVWFAYRLGPTTYGAFASFANDVDRQALLSAGGPRAARDNADLFVTPPTFEQVDILAARQPHAPRPEA